MTKPVKWKAGARIKLLRTLDFRATDSPFKKGTEWPLKSGKSHSNGWFIECETPGKWENWIHAVKKDDAELI